MLGKLLCKLGMHKWVDKVWVINGECELARFCKRCMVLEKFIDFKFTPAGVKAIYRRDRPELLRKNGRKEEGEWP